LTRSPFITLILFFFILPESTPRTMTLFSHSISTLPRPRIRVTNPSSSIRSLRLKAPLFSLFPLPGQVFCMKVRSNHIKAETPLTRIQHLRLQKGVNMRVIYAISSRKVKRNRPNPSKVEDAAIMIPAKIWRENLRPGFSDLSGRSATKTAG